MVTTAINANINANYSMRYKPMDYQRFNFNANLNGQLKNLWWAGFLSASWPRAAIGAA